MIWTVSGKISKAELQKDILHAQISYSCLKNWNLSASIFQQWIRQVQNLGACIFDSISSMEKWFLPFKKSRQCTVSEWANGAYENSVIEEGHVFYSTQYPTVEMYLLSILSSVSWRCPPEGYRTAPLQSRPQCHRSDNNSELIYSVICFTFISSLHITYEVRVTTMTRQWCCCLLAASRPSHMLLYLRDRSAQTRSHGATLRQKLQIKLFTSPSHCILTPDQPVPITPDA